MPRLKIPAVLSAMILFPVFLHAQELDSLIQQINRRMSAFKKDRNFECLVTSKEFKVNGDWEPEKTTIVEKKMTVDSTGAAFDILHAVEIEKGKEKDITLDLQKKMEEEKRKQEEKEDEDNKDEEKRSVSLGSKELNPFSEENRSQYNYCLLPDTVADSTAYYRIQTIAKVPDDKRFQGVFWINKKNSVIERIKLKPSKNPKFVKDFDLAFRFEGLDSNHWVIRQSHVRVYVSLLIKKIRIVSEETYENYRFPENREMSGNSP